ncbi:MAG: hypothetical protein WAS55_05960 [Saprospiraceae bacterium]
MTIAKILCILISSVNIYLGIRFFLNVINVLQTSKYSSTATALYAFLFLCLGFAGLYVTLVKSNIKLALWMGIGPWAIILVFLLANMIFGDYH